MSTNPDEAGALSPAERDFLQRRMPVETLAEFSLTPVERAVILRAADAFRDMALRLQRLADRRGAQLALDCELELRKVLK